MTMQYQTTTEFVSDALIDRLADEVRLEIQRRKNRRALAQGGAANVIAFRSSRAVA